MMSYFINIDGLVELEQQERWEEARELLYKIWESDKLNSGKLIRLLSECWQVLSLWDCCIKNESLSFQVFQDTLIECTKFGLKNFNDDSRFLCVTGYMISILPYLFVVQGTEALYTEWEQKGVDMLSRAYELDPNDKVAEILNLGRTSEFFEYNKALESITPELTTLFPWETYVDVYFKDILSIRYTN